MDGSQHPATVLVDKLRDFLVEEGRKLGLDVSADDYAVHANPVTMECHDPDCPRDEHVIWHCGLGFSFTDERMGNHTDPDKLFDPHRSSFRPDSEIQKYAKKRGQKGR